MTIMVNPYRHMLGADSVAGRLLGDEPSGVAVDFTVMQALIRDNASPLTQYFGNAASLLTYTAPSTKWVCDVTGNLVSGTTLRIDHDPVTHTPLGTLSEQTRINIVLWNRDLTNAAWVKTNITAAKDQAGVDGVASSASSLTATAANGTCLQTVTIAVNTRTQSAYVKRLVGSGAIEATQDNGTTWTPLAVTANWTRLSNPSASVTNPTIGFRIATSGDKIAVDMVQNEIGSFASSPIATTTAAVTRNFDQVSLPTSAFPYNSVASTLFAAGTFRLPSATGACGISLGDGTATSRSALFLSVSGTGQASILLNNGSFQVNSTLGGVIASGAEARAAFALEANNFAGVGNGNGVLVPDTVGTMTAPSTTMWMGCTYLATESLTGHIRRIKYLPRRVTNAELTKMVA